ncbi:hypothetical protein [Sphingomonas sp. Ant20]|uniref:hypothetical protein n=1 Tax=Sphingomonas sp. Ant20 TaxID=104605 RepID=UPI000537EB10|nr:hypothetical protein [Sphingomonas sp. Ant20]KHA62784.1 hypothetical protein NI18_20845 [Sphingomonas sp. Ant20]
MNDRRRCSRDNGFEAGQDGDVRQNAVGQRRVIIGPVAIFVAAGFEHSIANMSLLPIGWSG